MTSIIYGWWSSIILYCNYKFINMLKKINLPNICHENFQCIPTNHEMNRRVTLDRGV